MKARYAVLFAAVVSLLLACGDQSTTASGQDPGGAPTTLYVNADIVTVDAKRPGAQALAVRDGRILAVGSRDEVEAIAGDQAVVRDMGGRTIVPGLIDAHGHLGMTAMMMGFANVQPPPAGPAQSVADVQSRLRQWQAENPESPWILGWGYDDSLLAEQRHLTRDDLDAVSSELPVLVTHVSGHLLACNSRCLQLAGIDAATEDPPGGVIQRRQGSREPNGVLEELAMFAIMGIMPTPSTAQRLALLDRAQAYMAAHGITTLQDGATQAQDLALLQEAAARQRLYLDLVAFPLLTEGDTLPADLGVSLAYNNHFRVGGIKLVLDGSPQGKTAWLTLPYLHPPAGQPADYAGYPTMQDDSVQQLVSAAFSRGIPLIAHTNGDAAGDQLLRAVARANRELGQADRRTVMIHAQTAREDQIDAMQAEGVMPSYFVAHTFYWGDWHRDSVFGEPRASRISPLRSSVERGMRFTTHNDTPVVPPDMMRLLWAGVNRVTRSGQVLGPGQRVEPLEVLESMTIDAAYQYFEEDRKGSIEPGKLADLAVLSANPLTVDPMTIKDIAVVETIKAGVTVYAAGDG
jgi:predicted amidohydrolase YtcJ